MAAQPPGPDSARWEPNLMTVVAPQSLSGRAGPPTPAAPRVAVCTCRRRGAPAVHSGAGMNGDCDAEETRGRD